MLQKITKDNFVYNYQKCSTKNKLGTILFVHGYATDSHYHDVFAKKIKRYDYYSLELPGNGVNKKYKLNECNVFNYIKYVCDFINANKFDNLILIGHSMGGGIAAAVNRIMKDKIAKTILVTPMNCIINMKMLNLVKFSVSSEKSVYALYKLLYKNPEEIYKQRLNKKLKSEYKYFKDQAIVNKKVFMSMLSLRNYFRMQKDRRKLFSPTLLIVGKYDKIICSKSAIKAFRNFSKLKTVSFNDSGHLPFIEEPVKYFRTIMNFL